MRADEEVWVQQTIKGQVYTIVDDEITLDVDLRGEAKIDADGVLLGGEYPVPRILVACS
jgi:ribosomal protein S1